MDDAPMEEAHDSDESRTLWRVSNFLLEVVGFRAGRAWQRWARPRSLQRTYVLQALRFLSRWYRFDSFRMPCLLGRDVRVLGPVQVHLGQHCSIQDGAVIGGRGTFTMGSGSILAFRAVVVCEERIDVGNDVMIGGYSYIVDADHRYRSRSVPMRLQELRVAPIRIGDDVWIGSHTVILRGVTIGKGAVVAANSVVTRDVPEYTVVGGSPAVVLRERPED